MRLLVTALLLSMTFAGCVGPDAEPAFVSFGPAPEDPQALEYVARLRDGHGIAVPSGAGIWVHENYVFGSGLSAGLWIADVADPTDPELLFLGGKDDTPYSRDADLIEHEDGRLTLVLATQTRGVHFWDVSDPRRPTWQSATDVHLSHNVAVLPGTHFVFNSQHRGEGKTNDIIDASDPSSPVKIGTFGTHGCHDISFWVAPDGDEVLAGCAAVQRTELWDVTAFDPAAEDFGIMVLAVIEGGSAASPILGSPAFSRSPAHAWHHTAMLSDDGNVLIVGDEFNGASSPGACLSPADGVQQPFGALWFYDVSDRASPQLQSWFAPPIPEEAHEPGWDDPQAYLDGEEQGCTSHFGTNIPGMARAVFAWYTSGVILIDFSDPAAPVMLDRYQAHTVDYPDHQFTWDARVAGPYVFTGDIDRGMDVLRLV